jgi:ribosomal protein S18 acetylase RimI-like enzyme
MARIRAAEWGGIEYWERRISGYLYSHLDPQQALPARVCYVAVERDSVAGFVAGHLTRRHACQGELEWINVIPEQRGKNVATELLRLMAAWFVEQGARRVCVDVEPSNTVARAFYRRHGAADLHPHWLVWNDVAAILEGLSGRQGL